MAWVNVTPAEVRINASHLKGVPDSDLEAVINDVYTMYIQRYADRWVNYPDRLARLKVIEKWLAQHLATINVRRADSESLQNVGSKSISVPKDMDLDQTEYGQMARKAGKDLGLDWANEDDKPACIRIY